jgi:hypothetical protein
MNLPRAMIFLAGALIVKVTVNVMLAYRDYFPPNFESDFLRGREPYFSGVYQWAFYSHIVCGPVALMLGLTLVSEQFRIRLPKWHRALGKTQIVLILLLLTPSGLWLAMYAETGVVAAIGFSGLATVTGLCTLLGWWSAVNRRFSEHRRWMWRCFLLLCSAVILRLIGGLATVTGVGGNWSYPLAAWASWLVPLAAFEVSLAIHRQLRLSCPIREAQSVSSGTALSLPAMEISARR